MTPMAPARITPPRYTGGFEGDLAEDLAHDFVVLLRYFQAARTRFLGRYGVPALGLAMTPEMLVNLGVIRPDSIGRWDPGYRPAGALLRELEGA